MLNPSDRSNDDRKQELLSDVSDVRNRVLTIQREVDNFCASTRGSLTVILGRVTELVSAVEKLDT